MNINTDTNDTQDPRIVSVFYYARGELNEEH